VKTSQTAERPVRVGLVSLGCAKNLVDAEIMLGSLLKDGVEIVNDPASADAVIVNTCSFIDAAQEESVDAILESAQARDARNRGQALIVSGCLPQRFRDNLPKLLPEVDAFIGIDEVAHAAEIVRQAMVRRARRIERKHSTPEVEPRSSKQKIVGRLDQLNDSRETSVHEKNESLRGTERFGKTKAVLSARPATHLESHARPTFPISPHHASG
jgi:ribosomal protein S12 methylthiotransferase